MTRTRTKYNGSDQKHYHWRMCPQCLTIWKFGGVDWCDRCSAATVDANDLKQTMPPDDDRHGSEAGYDAGCREYCCQYAHDIQINSENAQRRALKPARLTAEERMWGPLAPWKPLTPAGQIEMDALLRSGIVEDAVAAALNSPIE